MYNAAGIANFQASPPNNSSQSAARDHGFPSRALSLITTVLQMTSFIISFRKTAVEAKYRAPFTTGMILE